MYKGRSSPASRVDSIAATTSCQNERGDHDTEWSWYAIRALVPWPPTWLALEIISQHTQCIDTVLLCVAVSHIFATGAKPAVFGTHPTHDTPQKERTQSQLNSANCRLYQQSQKCHSICSISHPRRSIESSAWHLYGTRSGNDEEDAIADQEIFGQAELLCTQNSTVHSRQLLVRALGVLFGIQYTC